MRCSQRICVSTCKNFILNIKKREEKGTRKRSRGLLFALTPILIEIQEVQQVQQEQSGFAICGDYFGYDLGHFVQESAQPLNRFYREKAERKFAASNN